MFTYIYSLLIEKDLCDCRNILVKTFMCLSSGDLFIFSIRVFLFLFIFLCYPYFSIFFFYMISNSMQHFLDGTPSGTADPWSSGGQLQSGPYTGYGSTASLLSGGAASHLSQGTFPTPAMHLSHDPMVSNYMENFRK